MKCQLIQTTKIGEENRAEQAMLAFLRNLPADYFVYRELQVTNTYRQRLKGYKKKKPDFVVVAPAVGVISIEVKDWNLDRNAYIWRDQYTIEVRPISGGPRTIRNPVVQIDDYLHAIKELLGGLNVFVTSLLAFPQLSQADFLSKLDNANVLRNPQSRFHLDLERTLFREHLDQHVVNPDALLRSIVEKHSKFRPSTEGQINLANERLMPSVFRIGDFTRRQHHKEKMKVITKRQQQWIFNLEPSKNYLLDVAGSGKTNALISKAIYLVDQADEESPPRILLTTYNENLERNIRRLFNHKIASSPRDKRYRDAITIRCMPALMERIVCYVLELDDIQAYKNPHKSRASYEKQLAKDAMSILRDDPDRFRRFDYVFIDEIQDFNDDYLLIADHLCRTNRFFFVGDIGQKIYDREHNPRLIDIVPERAELRKSYRMFRTPRYIGELATRFILNDPLSRQKFEERGYTEDFKPSNDLPVLPEIVRTTRPAQKIRDKILSLLEANYTAQDVMVIAPTDLLPQIADVLGNVDIPTVTGEPDTDLEAVVLVDFMNVKGLEKEVVFVTGIEDLYERSKSEALFDGVSKKCQKELFSRRKIYVALTRPLERLIVYYQDTNNRFVSELQSINQVIIQNRQGPSYGIQM
jgi:hypothetical protein